MLLKSQIIKCKHEFYNITQLIYLVRVFSQNYDLPDSVLRESLVGLVSIISEIGSFFQRDGTSLVDFSVTIFSGICLSLCNTFAAKGISNSIQTINMLTMFIVHLQDKSILAFLEIHSNWV